MRELVKDAKGLKKCGFVANISWYMECYLYPTREVHVVERGAGHFKEEEIH